MKIFNGNITQLNIGDIQGKLDNTFNCDLSFNQGKISVSPRTRITTNNPTDFGTPVGFVFFDTFWWTVAGSYVWKASNPQDNFEKDASTGGSYTTPNTCDSKFSDLIVFNDNLIVSTQDAIYRKVANGAGTGGWEKIDGFTPLSNNVSRMLAAYKNRL